MYRYNPIIINLIKRIKAGELGEIISVEAQMNCKLSKEVRNWLNNFPGGIMFYLGCHLVDLILQIMGNPERIIPLNKSTGFENISSQDFGMAVFEYKNGISFAKVISIEKGGFARRQIVVTGTKATAEIKPLEKLFDNGIYTEMTFYDSDDWHADGKSTRSEIFNRYDSMMKSFVQAITGERKNIYTTDYEFELYKTVINCCGGLLNG